MKHATRNIFSAMAVATATLTSLPAAAQPSRPDLPPPDRMRDRRPAGEGTQIHVRPDVGESVSRAFNVGESVQVEGHGIENQYGRSLEATAIDFGGAACSAGRAARPASSADPMILIERLPPFSSCEEQRWEGGERMGQRVPEIG